MLRLSRYFAALALVATLVGSAQAVTVAAGSPNGSTPQCPLSAQINCSVVQGRVVTEADKGIAGAIISFNGAQGITTGPRGHYEIKVPVQTYKGCGTFHIEVWAPGYIQKWYVYTVCGMKPPLSPQDWRPIPLEPANRDTECQATIHGLPEVSTPGPHTFHVWGKSSRNCEPEASIELLRFPGGRVRTYPLFVTYNNGYRFRGVVTVAGGGSYFVEVLDQRLLTMFNYPVFVGYKPTQFPDRVLHPDPVLTPDAFNATNIELRQSILKSVNRARSERPGDKPIREGQRLDTVSQAHVNQMTKYNYYFGHPHGGLYGSSPAQRMLRSGTNCSGLREVVAAVFRPQYVGHIGGELGYELLTSPAHRAFLLARGVTRAGIGVAFDSTLKLTEVTIDLCR
jgi:uncharacterized protein YkwD